MYALTPEFTFAGFTFPRYVADLPMGKTAMKSKRELRKVCGGYYHAPKPGRVAGWGFYDCDDAQFNLRIERTGDSFYCDPDGHDTMHAIVARLNHGRGFLVGWTMGTGMCASLDSDVVDDEDEARRIARTRTKDAAGAECDYQQRETDRLACEETAEALGGVALWIEE